MPILNDGRSLRNIHIRLFSSIHRRPGNKSRGRWGFSRKSNYMFRGSKSIILYFSFCSSSRPLLRSFQTASSDSRTCTFCIIASRSFLFSAKISLLLFTIAWKFSNLNSWEKTVIDILKHLAAFVYIKYLCSPTLLGPLGLVSSSSSTSKVFLSLSDSCGNSHLND